MPAAAAAAAATPAELAHLIARGDRRRAASLLVRDHAPAVFALCRAMVRDPRLAEDLSQDAFARAFGALDGFRGEASPRTWLLKIARNRCLDHLARARRAPWAGLDDLEPDDHPTDEPPPHDLLARREDAERAMAVLGESERALVVLHFGHGVGYPELADSFGLRAGAVRMRISRALARMRAALEGTDFGLEAPTLRRPALDGRDDQDGITLGSHAGAAAPDAFPDLDDEAEGLYMARSLDADVAEDDLELEAARGGPELDDARGGPELDDALEEETSLWAGSAARGVSARDAAPPTFGSLRDAAPPTFGSLHEEVSPALRGRLDALAAAV